MVELDEREVLLRSLRGYLEDLEESGIDELPFAAELETPAAAAAQVPAVEAAPVAITAAGRADAKLAFVMTGAGFAGASGALLAKIVAAMGFAPQDVFLLSFSDEAAADASLREELLSRLAAAAPEVVIALGERAARVLFGSADPISRLRGRFVDLAGTRMMATLHPDQLLADETLKRGVWNEMKQVMALLARKHAR